MSYFQRIKSGLQGIFLFLFALLLLFTPEESNYIIAIILGFSLFVYGFRILWFYFTMSRHMVGGKTSLYQAIIVLDLALFTASVASMNSLIILFYLLGVYAFSGLVDILRAMEEKKIGAPGWKRKLVNGVISVLFAVVLVIFGLFRGRTEYLVFGYSLSLCYAAIIRIVRAFRKPEAVYIQ